MRVWISPRGCFLAEVPGKPRADVDSILEEQTPVFTRLSRAFNRASKWWEAPRPKVGSEVRVMQRARPWALRGVVGTVKEVWEDENGYDLCFVVGPDGLGAAVEDDELRVLMP